VASQPDRLDQAVEVLKKDFFSESNSAPRARRQQDVETLAEMVNRGVDPFPLQPSTVLKFAAAIKAAGFSSGPQYLGALRLAHVERDHAVGPALKRTFELTKRALERNRGPSRRAPELQVADFKSALPDWRPGKLVYPKLTYSLAVAFMLRRCELEKLSLDDIHVNQDKRRVTLHIRSAKMDQQAKGAKRTLGCTCSSMPSHCPFETTLELVHALTRSGLKDPVSGKIWLTSMPDGRRAVKSKVVKAWAKASGRPVQGHTARRSGALHYIRAGVAVSDVTYLGRWHSDLVFQYAEEAMEDRAANLAATARAPRLVECSRHTAGASPSTAPAAASEDRQAAHLEEPAPDSGAKLLKPGELLARTPRWVKAHGRSKVLHLVEDLAQPTSAAWRTKCGWTFARTSHFSLYISLPSDASRCRKCRLSQPAQRG
jgi:hypothetical protein